ncbi:alpha-D-ribose 1-methylphosphonate 5-triphosphate diphosphatase [Paenibacillus sp. GCM10023252]|uniref:alpha-D-ribose 1-methylphosphonate 5-triphosphate diphosphatase n=1 Tax=Paenibacillus sp. GCM10023252 TaxID=3252649 RepID=UPI00361AB21C
MEHMQKKTQSLLIHGGTIVLPDEAVTGAVAIRDGVIEGVLTSAESVQHWMDNHPDAQYMEAGGRYVLPGLIDIHCDALEKEVQPRPNTLFPLDMSLLEFERKLPLHGITTMYHSLSLGVGLSLRGDHYLTGMIDQISRYRSKRSMVRNRIHLRYEVSHLDGLARVEQYLNDNQIDYLSFMDHSPGQGQYREEGSFERYVMKNQGVTAAEVGHIVSTLAENRAKVDWDKLEHLGRLAGEQGIAVASHDDDSSQMIEDRSRLGVSICEFPINMETAKVAADRGIQVCVGAPNVVRGVSHDHNLRASDAIAAGVAHILCSDYHPSSLLTAIFKLVDDGVAALPEAVRMATLHPAQALGIDDHLGSIVPGRAADLIIVDRFEGHPLTVQTLVGGTTVFTCSER